MMSDPQTGRNPRTLLPPSLPASTSPCQSASAVNDQRAASTGSEGTGGDKGILHIDETSGPTLAVMSPILSSNAYSLDFDELYARMWEIAIDDRRDGTKLYQPDSASALKWLIAELSGTPAVVGATRLDNNLLRKQVHEILGDGWAERLTDTTFRLLRPPTRSDRYQNLHDLMSSVAQFSWPTVEWVKVPVDRQTGEPNGDPIRMRHFLDCSHWHLDDEGNLLGAPPMVATDRQMRDLRPCKDCVNQAAAASNPEVGPRLTEVSDTHVVGAGAFGLPSALDLTDGTAVTAVRREQRHLREHLLAGREEAPCALCGRTLPENMLVAAHIAPRHSLNEAERLDFTSAAMLACALGCDALFERGYVSVDDTGRIVGHRPVDNETLREAVSALVGRDVAAFSAVTSPRFSQHRSLHLLPQR